jgi:hypothetical protein
MIEGTRMKCESCDKTKDVKKYIGRPYFSLCKRCYDWAKRSFNSRRGKKRDRIVLIPKRHEWIAALRHSWDARLNVYRCAISGVPLSLTPKQGPCYPTLEHDYQSDGSCRFTVVAAAINDMKSDMTLSEFRTAIKLLSAVLSSPNSKATKRLAKTLQALKHWRRTNKTLVVVDK